MLRELPQIAADLDALTPSDFDYRNPAGHARERLKALCDELVALNEPAACAPILFALMERLDSADLGSPGPLVHTLEQWNGEHETLLAESVGRKPTPLSLWMVNRILNANPPDGAQWLKLLVAVTEDPTASAEAKADARQFIDYQTRSGRGGTRA